LFEIRIAVNLIAKETADRIKKNREKREEYLESFGDK
jgi:hypothetical protein